MTNRSFKVRFSKTEVYHCKALREYAFNKNRRDQAPSELRAILAWIRRNSLPMSAWEDPEHVDAVLHTLDTRLDGAPAAANSTEHIPLARRQAGVRRPPHVPDDLAQPRHPPGRVAGPRPLLATSAGHTRKGPASAGPSVYACIQPAPKPPRTGSSRTDPPSPPPASDGPPKPPKTL